jgi:hypothetical protein
MFALATPKAPLIGVGDGKSNFTYSALTSSCISVLLTHQGRVCNQTTQPELVVSVNCSFMLLDQLYGLNYATACACLYDTSMLASMIYL